MMLFVVFSIFIVSIFAYICYIIFDLVYNRNNYQKSFDRQCDLTKRVFDFYREDINRVTIYSDEFEKFTDCINLDYTRLGYSRTFDYKVEKRISDKKIEAITEIFKNIIPGIIQDERERKLKNILK